MIDIDEILNEIASLERHKNAHLSKVSLLFNLNDNLKGCSSEEISKIESFYQIRLPSSYKKFLSKIGHNAGYFLRGTDAFYNTIFEQKLRIF